jgi:hypothetical protein
MRSLREFDLGQTSDRFTAPAELIRNAVAYHPGNPVPRHQQWDPAPFVARNFGIHEEILELLRPGEAQRSEPIPRTPRP